DQQYCLLDRLIIGSSRSEYNKDEKWSAGLYPSIPGASLAYPYNLWWLAVAISESHSNCDRVLPSQVKITVYQGDGYPSPGSLKGLAYVLFGGVGIDIWRDPYVLRGGHTQAHYGVLGTNKGPCWGTVQKGSYHRIQAPLGPKMYPEGPPASVGGVDGGGVMFIIQSLIHGYGKGIVPS
ncbi:hypothetical protein G9A89_000688, partial [Geosiphon pyriformis]